MDNTLTEKNKDIRAYRFFPALLLSLIPVFAAVGMKFHPRSLGSLSFYGRYDGIGIMDSLQYIRAVLICSAPTLVQILLLYLFSFSRLLIPFSIFIVSIRGFILGTAAVMASAQDDFLQTGIYCMITLAIWLMGASFCMARLRKSEKASAKTLSFLTISGVCITGEFILSFIL